MKGVTQALFSPLFLQGFSVLRTMLSTEDLISDLTTYQWFQTDTAYMLSGNRDSVSHCILSVLKNSQMVPQVIRKAEVTFICEVRKIKLTKCQSK